MNIFKLCIRTLLKFSKIFYLKFNKKGKYKLNMEFTRPVINAYESPDMISKLYLHLYYIHYYNKY